LRITPEGEDVAIGNQIVIQFDRPVVPIGVMERNDAEIPVKISPELKCQWRWINTSALACNLDEKEQFKIATTYNVVVSPGIKSADGKTISETFNHQFTTIRPDVEYAWLDQWLSPSQPVINVYFNQYVTKSSVEKSLSFVSKDEKSEVEVSARPEDGDVKKVDGDEARKAWMVSSKNKFDLNKDVALQLGAGLSSGGEQISNQTRSILALHTFAEFSFIGVKCFTNLDEEVMVSQDQSKLCDPMRGAALVFTSPVSLSEVKKHITFDPPINFGEDISQNEGERIVRQSNGGGTYEVWLPDGLKAITSYHIKTSEKNIFAKIWHWIQSIFFKSSAYLMDDFGRYLKDEIDVVFKTDNRRPNFEMVYSNAVIESGIDSEVPLYVTNIDKAIFNYRKISTSGSQENLTSEIKIDPVRNIQFSTPLNVREILGGKSGAVYGVLESEPQLKKTIYEKRLFAQVTPFSVHFKFGHFNGLVWVTNLATGEPVSEAAVTIYKDKLTDLKSDKPSLVSVVTDSNGMAVVEGLETLDPNLDFLNRWEFEEERFFVKVVKGEDMALLPVSNDFQINSYRISDEDEGSFYSSNRRKFGHIKAWGTTSQGIYRAGDVISYKFYVRNQNNKELIMPPLDGYHLEIVDPTDNVVFKLDDIKLNSFGSYFGDFALSKESAVGWYSFRLTRDGSEESWFPIKVLVSDFTPSSFKVTNQVNGDVFKVGQEVEIATQAKLYSGGPYTDANLRLTTMLEQKSFTSNDKLARDFTFDSFVSGVAEEQVFQKIDQLGNNGEKSIKFKLEKSKVLYGRLIFESAVQDDRGKYIASQSFADYAGVDRFIGLKAKGWIFNAKKDSEIQWLVVNERGALVDGVKANISIERQEIKVAKVKSAGNAYLSEFSTEWVKLSDCKGSSSKTAAINCKFNPKLSGYYRAVGQVLDSAGNEHKTEINFYVTGSDYVLWDDGSDDYALTIIPERTDYKVGDKAHYLVKNPYPGAKALITVERYGILDSFVQTLEGSTPVIELSIKPEYVPGFYLSVTVFSPRSDKPIENQVDLGKPSFRIGYESVTIKDRAKEMLVSVKSDREKYKPREKVKLAIHAEPKIKGKNEKIELAVLVLDEAVFDLVAGGSKYFDPYNGFYRLDSLDLKNYSLLTRLIGRQKFEKKGANPGGDGGADLSMRNIFKFVGYWNPSLMVDLKGNANVEFEAPDNLTGWRVLILATTPTDAMGLGETGFKVNKPTEIRPVMPNQVTEGDSFEAAFSIMNRTETKREISVLLKAQGDIDAKNAAPLQQKIMLEPYKRAIVKMPLQTKNSGKITFFASAKDQIDGDALEHVLLINKYKVLETSSNYGATTENEVEEAIKFPEKIRGDVGDLSIVLSPSVVGNMDSAFEYLRDYPFLCWEQRLTKAVMAARYIGLKSYVKQDFTWPEAVTLPITALEDASSFQAPNGGMTYFVANDEYVDPYLSAYTALAFNWLKKSGYKIPTNVEEKLISYLDNFLRQETQPQFYAKGMAATVRSVAMAALVDSGNIKVSDLERYRASLGDMGLFGKSYYAQAAMKVQGGMPFATQAVKMILANSNQTGGKISFIENSTENYSRILASEMRDNCAALSAFSEFGKTEEGSILAGDITTKLARFIAQSRLKNTQENVFCLNALFDYASVYESAKPEMKISVALDGSQFGIANFSSVRDNPVTLVRKITKSDVGKSAKATISRSGDGRLYYSTRLSSASLDNNADYKNAGIEVRREYSVQRDGKWTILKSPIKINQSEVVKVDIFVMLPAARNFVVVNDPVAGGLEPVNRDILTSSIIDAKKADSAFATGSYGLTTAEWNEFGNWYGGFYHKELRNDSARFYAEHLEAGKYHLSYTAQAIAAGKFMAMPLKAEEMYDPDVYGLGISESFEIKPVQ